MNSQTCELSMDQLDAVNGGGLGSNEGKGDSQNKVFLSIGGLPVPRAEVQ